MRQTIASITPENVINGALAGLAVSNPYWYDYLNYAVQFSLGIGGLIYWYYMIRTKRSEWLLNRNKLKREKSNETQE